MTRLFGPPQVEQCAFLPGAIGDSLAALPVIRTIVEEFPDQPYTFYAQDHIYKLARALMFVNGLAGKNVRIRRSSLMNKDFKDGKQRGGRAFNINPPYVTTLQRSLTEQAYLSLLDYSIMEAFEHPERMKYLSVIPNEYESPRWIYVAVTSKEKNRVLPEVFAKEIFDVAQMMGMDIMLVGRTTDGETLSPVAVALKKLSADTLFGAPVVVDRVNRFKGLLGLLKAMRRNAAMFVGADGGLMHLAACVEGLPVVGYFSNVDPKHRKPIGHPYFFSVTPDPVALACRFCQTRSKFLYDFDFRTCGLPDPSAQYGCAKGVGLTPSGVKKVLTTAVSWSRV